MNCLNFGTLILAFEYNMGSRGLDGSPLLLIYGFHVTEHLRAVADQKRVLYWSRWKYYWNQIKSVHNDFEVTLDYRKYETKHSALRFWSQI